MLATLYNVAVDLPLQESAWWLAFLWFCRCLYLFSYIRCYCCGSGEPCDHCSGNSGPTDYQIVIAGVVNGTCVDCGNWNATRTASFNAGDGSFACCWATPIFSLLCAGAGNADHVYINTTGAGDFIVTGANTGGVGAGNRCVAAGISPFWNFLGSYTSDDIPCKTFSAEDIPLFSGANPQCDFSAATCEVTAL
jgi:hypothetical protein